MLTGCSKQQGLVGERYYEEVQIESWQDDKERYNELKTVAEETRIKREEELRRLEEERIRKEIEEQKRKDNVRVNLDNVRELSGLTVDELVKVLSYKEYSKEMIKLAPVIIEAENTYNINAFVISGIIGVESGYGRSNRARNDHNYMGWGVYSASSKGVNYNDDYTSIMKACSYLDSDYLTEGGRHFNGYGTWGISRSYCLEADGSPSDKWRIDVNSIAKNFEWVYKNIVK